MAERTFSLLHLSLIERQQPYLLEFFGNREEWLRFALSKSFTFSGWGGRELVWVPKGESQGLIFGLIQGRKPYAYHEPPSEGGRETEGEFWQGAYLFIDPSHHVDGQKMAVENDVLGRPRALAESLFDYINSRDDARYSIIAELVFDENNFWKFAKENGGILRFIKFQFVVPNMWGPQNDLEEDLKETGKSTGSEQVDVVFRGSGGVTTNNEKVRTGVSYAGRGAGIVKARSLDGKSFSSESRPTTVSVPDADLDEASDATLGDIASRVLGRG